MSAEETARLLTAAAHAAEAAAQAIMVPSLKDSQLVRDLVERSQELLSFACQCGAVPRKDAHAA